MQDLRISIIQTDLFWEDTDKNLHNLDLKLSTLKEKTDLIILPEMFNTGFSMNLEKCAEPIDGKTMQWLKTKAKNLNAYIIGSIQIREKSKYFNRLIMMEPDGDFMQYDKRHLFRQSDENILFTKGKKKMIADIKGWKICPLVCYDLRFPVWSKNKFQIEYEFEYDCLIYVANWPQSRKYAWQSLLIARAIENQSYVIGVNRIGEDGNSITHSGNSLVLDFKGKSISNLPENIEFIETVLLSKKDLYDFRNKFKVSLDWDHFELKDNI